jgi:arylsulfatase A-like enzyme
MMPATTPARPASSVRQDGWRLIRFYCDNADQSNRHELYNLGEDPGERHDLAAAQPDPVKQLGAHLDQYLRETGAVIPKPNPAYDPNAASLRTNATVPSKINQ